jgi:Glycosyltransferase family 10 (fucosyltransferase) C-term/Fucosyltransferase, N-terminal/Glycosyl transferase family 2
MAKGMGGGRRDIIAIPTFNRVQQLVACLTCLREARGLERFRVFIRDDASTGFGVREIARLIPQAERIERNATNLGPDASQLLLFRDCLDAGASRVLVLDSDMIVSPSVLEFAEYAFDRTDGVLGLYNSAMHTVVEDIDAELIAKRTLGGAATFWEAELLSRVVERCRVQTEFTWDKSAAAELRAMGRRIVVSRRSYAQHLGIQGENNGIFGRIDYGRGFIVETECQARFMAAAFDGLMTHQSQFMPRKRRRRGIRRLLGSLKRKQRGRGRRKEQAFAGAPSTALLGLESGLARPQHPLALSQAAAGLSVRLFWRAAYRDRGSKPVILFFNDFFGRPPDTQSLARYDACVFTTDRRKLGQAAAVIFHIPSLKKLGKVRKRPGQLWVAWSMESEVNYPKLADPAFMRNFDLTMTYRTSADIWSDYLPSELEFERALAAPLPAKNASAPAVMFQSSNVDRSGRNEFARELMSHMPVDSYGRFLNNRQIAVEDRGHETKLATIASYKFSLGFENSIADDYVTEKFFDPFLAGTVPVYRGAANVEMFAPGENAFIDATKFAGPRELAEHLMKLDQDEDAYRQYFRWRENGLSADFKRLLARSSKGPFCQLCEIVLARRPATAREHRPTRV